MVIEIAEVVSNDRLARGLYAMELGSPLIAADARPGQFVNVLIDPGYIPLLRRPMSIAGCDGERIQLIYKVFGNGTQAMAGWRTGHLVDLLGPLGNGWSDYERNYPVLVGGGVGIAPVAFLHNQLVYLRKPHHLIMGARDREEHYLEHSPENGITLTTDNGTTGIAGTVVNGLEYILPMLKDKRVILYGCGPPAMIVTLKSFAIERNLPCQLSLEEIMGCGFGNCQGCSVVVKTTIDRTEHSYRERYRLVCLDGPVFWAHELCGEDAAVDDHVGLVFAMRKGVNRSGKKFFARTGRPFD